MNSLQRFAWLLLGLCVLVGVAHAPLHADADYFGEECSLLALCSGAIVLLLWAAVPMSQHRASSRQPRRVVAVVERCSPARFAHGSRGPPAW
ncbi:MAG: hypothetical protein GY747_09775 [Planctomycetes bacterium]|nr:hypothetical protein [Planctomycetota bacterium]MCP4771682.1 hypothetical protein [Planctomycetota bacterium]MCP4860018.1 hypothetical protein [Planctomycetota bacterium]